MKISGIPAIAACTALSLGLCAAACAEPVKITNIGHA